MSSVVFCFFFLMMTFFESYIWKQLEPEKKIETEMIDYYEIKAENIIVQTFQKSNNTHR